MITYFNSFRDKSATDNEKRNLRFNGVKLFVVRVESLVDRVFQRVVENVGVLPDQMTDERSLYNTQLLQ